MESTLLSRIQTRPAARMRRSIARPGSVATDGVDRISQLPDDLLYKITSLLPPETAAQTEILSKRWLNLRRTSPTIDLKEVFPGKPYTQERRQVFINYIETIMTRYELANLERLTLQTSLPLDDLFEGIVSNLLQVAIENETKNLEFCFVLGRRGPSKEGYYSVPGVVFVSDSLITLGLESCLFDRVNHVRLLALKELSLTEIILSDEILLTLVKGCPSMEKLTIANCYGFERPMVKSNRMKTLNFKYCPQILKLELSVPCLENLTYAGDMSTIRLHSVFGCDLVTSLTLSYVTFDEYSFEDLVWSFTNLRHLNLFNCKINNVPIMSIKSLRGLEMVNCRPTTLHLPLITPNLEFLRVSNFLEVGHLRPYLRLLGKYIRSILLGSNIRLQSEIVEKIMAGCRFLENFSLLNCSGFEQLIILSKSLRSLWIENCSHLVNCEIDAPNLIFFKYTGQSINFRRIKGSEALTAELRVLPHNLYYRMSDEAQITNLDELLLHFPHAQHVTIIDSTYQVHQNRDRKVLKERRHVLFRTSFEDIKIVKFFTELFNDLVTLKTFSILTGSISIEMTFKEFAESSDKKQKSSISTSHDCLKDQLTEIKMEEFVGNLHEMELLEFLLEKAFFVESVSILFKSTCTRSHRLDVMKRIGELYEISRNPRISFVSVLEQNG